MKTGEKNLSLLLKNIQPFLNKGEYVFSSISSFETIDPDKIIMSFKEEEGITIIVAKCTAEAYNLSYSFIASWITLKIHSSLEAVGLTAAFSNALAKYNISCNVVAGFYHDHVFVAKKDEVKAIQVLSNLAKR